MISPEPRLHWIADAKNYKDGKGLNVVTDSMAKRWVNKGIWYKSDSLKERFLRHVSKDETGCWLWTGNIDAYGYGRLSFKGRSQRASRFSFEIFKNMEPGNLYVCHSCDNPRCVNPEHLFLGDQKANMRDCVSKSRQNLGQRNGQARLAEADVRDILNSIRQRKSRTDVAKSYGVSVSTIEAIVNGRRWKHIPREV